MVNPSRPRTPPLVLDGSGTAAGTVTRSYTWRVFAIAFALMAVDFMDRQVVVATFPALKAEWQLSDTQLGALVSIVSVTVALCAVPAALVVDRWSRVKAIAVMGTTWSLATLAAGITQNFAQLLAARALVGAGEAGYGPAAGALLSSVFPARKRATVLGAFQAAAPVGTVLGVLLGGVIVANWGWRAAFGLFAIPGLVLALAFLTVRDYRSVRVPRSGSGTGDRVRATVGGVFRARSGIAAYVGGAFQLMVIATLYAWLPSYLNRYYGLAVDRSAALAAVVIVAGAAGTVVFGYLADRRAARDPRARLLVPAALSLLTLALLTMAFAVLTPGPTQLALVLAGGLTMTGTVGPVVAVVTDVVHPGLRATAISATVVVQNLLGQATGPVLTGLLSDLYGLPTALALMPIACGGAAVVFWYGSRSYCADRDAVSSAGASPADTDRYRPAPTTPVAD